METLFSHKTIRKFQAKDIETEKLETILHAAARSSNTGNMQWYSIIVTKDQSLKEQLCKQAHFNQQMVNSAPIVLTFCADLYRFTNWCKINNAEPGYDNFLSFYTASIDATIAAQNACIAAEELGLGICYLGTTNYNAKTIISLLNLPELVIPVTTVVLGYPDENPEQTDRLPQKAIIHNETYSIPTDSEIADLYKEKENLVMYKKFITDNSVENLAQVFTKKRYTTENNKLFSQSLLDIISHQGFMNNI